MKPLAFLLAGIAVLGTPAADAAIPEIGFPAPDIAATLAADARLPPPRAERFAVAINTLITPRTHGTWRAGPDGSWRWRVAVRADGARNLNFGFTAYHLPDGATLELAAPGGADRRGPYGPAHNRLGQLWTPIVRGDRAVIELSVPPGGRDDVVLQLTRVNYGFRDLDGASAGAGDAAGACDVDVACPPARDWPDEIRAVARITAQGVLYCSGTLLNNTRQDFTPYFLTAAHCVTAHAQAPATVFYWNYQTSRCGGPRDGSMAQSSSGALMLATSAASDFSLLQLLERPPASYRVYYAGWDHRPMLWTDVTGIHHPGGLEKRISRYTGPTQISGYAPGAYANDPQAGAAVNPVFLALPKWDVGQVAGGSSGSGLWNADHRLVGNLSGNIWSCGMDPVAGGAIWYGRFHMNWFQYPSPATSPAFWLDPDGSGVDFLDGADPAPAPDPPPEPDPQTGGDDSGGGGAATGSLLVLVLAALRRRHKPRRRLLRT